MSLFDDDKPKKRGFFRRMYDNFIDPFNDRKETAAEEKPDSVLESMLEKEEPSETYTKEKASPRVEIVEDVSNFQKLRNYFATKKGKVVKTVGVVVMAGLIGLGAAFLYRNSDSVRVVEPDPIVLDSSDYGVGDTNSNSIVPDSTIGDTNNIIGDTNTIIGDTNTIIPNVPDTNVVDFQPSVYNSLGDDINLSFGKTDKSAVIFTPEGGNFDPEFSYTNDYNVIAPLIKPSADDALKYDLDPLRSYLKITPATKAQGENGNYQATGVNVLVDGEIIAKGYANVGDPIFIPVNEELHNVIDSGDEVDFQGMTLRHVEGDDYQIVSSYDNGHIRVIEDEAVVNQQQTPANTVLEQQQNIDNVVNETPSNVANISFFEKADGDLDYLVEIDDGILSDESLFDAKKVASIYNSAKFGKQGLERLTSFYDIESEGALNMINEAREYVDVNLKYSNALDTSNEDSATILFMYLNNTNKTATEKISEELGLTTKNLTYAIDVEAKKLGLGEIRKSKMTEFEKQELNQELSKYVNLENLS